MSSPAVGGAVAGNHLHQTGVVVPGGGDPPHLPVCNEHMHSRLGLGGPPNSH